MPHDIAIIKEYKLWKSQPELTNIIIKKLVKATLKLFPLVSQGTIELAILMTDNAKMQELNLQFRGKNAPTNVLSFPDKVITYEELLEKPAKSSYINIGDIALGYEIIAAEALTQNISFYQHTMHLVTHGVLHLLGFDHQYDEEAKQMMALETKILSSFNIPCPYLEK